MGNKLEIVYIKAGDLVPLENNPRRARDPKAIDKLAILIKEHGFQNPLQVYREKDGRYSIICGNYRYRAGRSLGMDEFPCIIYEGDRNRALARAISDNKSGEWTEFDLPKLSDIFVEIDTGDFSLPDLTGFDKIEIKGLIDRDGETNPDTIPEIPEKPRTSPGDLWLLEKHRLLCGDSTKREDMERLMGEQKADMIFTDPPYGVSYGDKNAFLNKYDKGNCIQTPIMQDHVSEKEIMGFRKKSFEIMRDNLADTNSYYIFGPQIQGMMMMMMMMMEAGLPYRHVIIWVKNNHVLGRCDYHYRHEPLFFGWTTKHKFYGQGEFKTSVWEVDKPLKNDLHPTMKPIRLIENALLNSSLASDICLDPFLGSGSTLIACEKTGRVCYGLEIEPCYCDVILDRWSNFTGKDPVREDGARWSELKQMLPT